MSINFRRLQAEPNLYIRKEGSDYVIIGVYVDDLQFPPALLLQ